MKISKEEFLKTLEEGQNNLLKVLADDPDVDTRKFFKVAGALELISLYGGVIYSIISPNVDEERLER
ncbi:MAG TPA: hypothetical protein VF691_23025 [Cytophagaceae bacterium]|jgi:hypothetical protein